MATWFLQGFLVLTLVFLSVWNNNGGIELRFDDEGGLYSTFVQFSFTSKGFHLIIQNISEIMSLR